jgi:hypothetical protein
LLKLVGRDQLLDEEPGVGFQIAVEAELAVVVEDELAGDEVHLPGVGARRIRDRLALLGVPGGPARPTKDGQVVQRNRFGHAGDRVPTSSNKDTSVTVGPRLLL